MTPADTSVVRWTTTTEREPWREQTPVPLQSMTGLPSVIVELDRPQQEVEGFGGCFNEMGWTSLAAVHQDRREEVLRQLFSPGVGANFTLCRMPIGANDISRNWYSYDETPGDFALADFSIANDLETLVPYIHAAQRHQPELRLWASPWSPPTWMKRNGHYAAAMAHPAFPGAENGLREDQVGHEGTDMIRLEPEVLDAYAEYFGRFVDAYAEEGIEIGMVMPQNEFNSAQVFPSCTWTPEGLAAFIRHLGPQMRRRDVEVFLGTLERADPDLVDRVLADDGAREYIEGVGIQWHGKDAAAFVHRDHPALRIYQTEQECGDGRNDWRLARRAWDLMRLSFTSGASAYMYWNIALLDGGMSRWNWAQNSLFSIDADSGTATANHELHIISHVSHFVHRGARVIPTVSYTGFENQLAFRNPDGELVVVMLNPLAAPLPVQVAAGDRVLDVELPADSLSTFVFPAD